MKRCCPGFGFLSRKPVLVVLNLSEGQAAPELTYTHKHSTAGGAAGQAGDGYRPAARRGSPDVPGGIRHRRTQPEPHDPPVL